MTAGQAAVDDPVGARAHAIQRRAVHVGDSGWCLTFGGAYTAIPFVEDDAVGEDGWMTTGQFLDGLALSGVIPAPLVIFATFVGYAGGGPLGAVAMTIGIFLPAFITLVGHRYLEAAVANVRLHAILDGITARRRPVRDPPPAGPDRSRDASSARDLRPGSRCPLPVAVERRRGRGHCRGGTAGVLTLGA